MTKTPLKAVVFDWAGTMIDFGCMAPVAAYQTAFAAEGVQLAAASTGSESNDIRMKPPVKTPNW